MAHGACLGGTWNTTTSRTINTTRNSHCRNAGGLGETGMSAVPNTARTAIAPMDAPRTGRW